MAQSTSCHATSSSLATTQLRFLQQRLCAASECSHIFTR
uniref:Uncharacterized protein n=1 Tax=Arundo donax TaxID=35708 RepID=A0A0A9DHN1_ARUDO